MIVKVFDHYTNEGIESMIQCNNSIVGRDFTEIHYIPLANNHTRVIMIWRNKKK